MNQEIVDLILSLNITSTKDRFTNLIEFFMNNPNLFSDEQKQILIAAYKNSRDKKVEQGKKDIDRRWEKKNKKENGNWIFKEHSSYRGQCISCSQHYEINDPIFVKMPEKQGYHLLCAPDQAKLEENKCYIFYKKYLDKQIEENKIISIFSKEIEKEEFQFDETDAL